MQSVTLVGNLTADPRPFTTANGDAAVGFTLALNKKNKDGEELPAVFMEIIAFKSLAEHVTKSLTKGMFAMVQGELIQREVNVVKDGREMKLRETSVRASYAGGALNFATASYTKSGNANGGGQYEAAANAAAPAPAPAANPAPAGEAAAPAAAPATGQGMW